MRVGRRLREGRRLRPREDARRDVAAEHHEPRHRLRHARVHEPRAGARRPARRAQRSLRGRRHPLSSSSRAACRSRPSRRRRSCSRTSSQRPAGSARGRARAADPASARRRHARRPSRRTRTTASRTPTSSRRRSRDALAHGRGPVERARGRRRAAAVRRRAARSTRRRRSSAASAARRRRPTQLADAPAPPPREPAAAGDVRVGQRGATGARASDCASVRCPLPFIGARGRPRVARGARAAEARSLDGRAHRRRRRRRQVAPACASSSTSRAAAGDVVVQTGPDPGWAEVGYWALRRAIVQLAALPATAAAPRDWVGRHARGAPRPRRRLRPASPERVAPRSRPTSAASPRPRRCAGRSCARASARAAPRRPRGRRSPLRRRREPQRLRRRARASRRSCRRCSSPPTRPGFDPGWPADVAAARVLTRLPTAEVAARSLAHTASAELAGAQRRAHHRAALPRAAPALRARGVGRAPRRARGLIALRVERLPRRRAARAPGGRRLGRRRATTTLLTRMLGDEASTWSRRSAFLRRAGMIARSAPTGIRTSPPAPPRGRRSPPSPPRCGASSTPRAAVVCDERELPLEVRALHEYHAQDAFQALLLLERVSVARRRARRPSGRHHGAPSRSRARAPRALPRRARRPDARGAHLQPQARRGARARRAVQRRRGRPPRGARRGGPERAGPRGASSARWRTSPTIATAGRRRGDYLREALELASRSGAHELVTSLETLRRSIAS